VAYTVALLAGLIVVERFVTTSSLSDGFKNLFLRVHETVLLANYILLTFRGIVRIARSPLD
jgi:hypothetical protein